MQTRNQIQCQLSQFTKLKKIRNFGQKDYPLRLALYVLMVMAAMNPSPQRARPISASNVTSGICLPSHNSPQRPMMHHFQRPNGRFQ